MTGFDYVTDGAAIYRESFATIRREADLARFDADTSQVVVRMIHACGQVDLAAPGSDVVAVHWRHPIDGMELDGDGVHRRLAEMPRLDVIGSWTEADFRIDVLRLR